MPKPDENQTKGQSQAISQFDLIKSIEINWCLQNETFLCDTGLFGTRFTKTRDSEKRKDKLLSTNPKERKFGFIVWNTLCLMCSPLKCEFNHLIY